VRIRADQTNVVENAHACEQLRGVTVFRGEKGIAMINRIKNVIKSLASLRSICVTVIALLAIASPALAHHGGAAYDTDKTVTVKGKVTDFIWANPHVFVKVDGKDDAGNTVHWIVEAQNPVSMLQIGWSKSLFKPGDEVEIDAMPAKNGNPVAFLGSSSPTAPRRRIVINGKQFQ
jgi:hypothetical protein